MGYEQIGGAKVFRPWVGWTEGDSFEGILRGTSEDNYGKTNWEFEVVSFEFDEEVAVVVPKKGKNAGQKVEYPAPKVGDIFVLNSSGSLDKAMEKVELGDKVKVIYEGTVILNKGPNKGSECHTMKVFRDSSSNKSALAQSKAKAAPAEEIDEDVL